MWRRRDDNHAEIIRTLRNLGAKVFDTADIGRGFPDAVVDIRGRLWLIEIKDGKKPPSQQKLTPSELEFHKNWWSHVVILNSVESAVKFITTGKVA